MRRFFLPCGLILAAILALLVPGPAPVLRGHHAVDALVMVIFLASGLQADFSHLGFQPRTIGLLVASAVSSLILAPFIGLAIIQVLHLDQGAAIGLGTIALVPPTLSAGVVITGVCGGDIGLALLLTVVLNILGILTIPVMAELILHSVATLAIHPWAMAGRLTLLVLLPMALGQALRQQMGRRPWFSGLSYLNSSCVILVVYIVLGSSAHSLADLTLGITLAIVLTAILFHTLLLGLNHLLGRLLKRPLAQRQALLFVTSQKTLPLALVVLAGLEIDTGVGVLFCLCLHFLQLFIDSLLAG